MRGRRGACLATGQHQTFLRGLTAHHEQAFLITHTMGIEEEDRRDLLVDFASGDAHVVAELDIRLSVWDCLPLKAMSLSYPDETVGRDHMIKCMAQFEQATGNERASMHSFTLSLFEVGELRQQLVSWIQGEPMGAELRDIADVMCFVPTSEVSVERLHAFLKQRTIHTHHTTAAYDSLQLRRPEILEAHEKFPDHFAECCSLVASPMKVVKMLKLEHHPAFLSEDASADGGAEIDGAALETRFSATLVGKVVYRCDMTAPYLKLGKAQRNAVAGVAGGDAGRLDFCESRFWMVWLTSCGTVRAGVGSAGGVGVVCRVGGVRVQE